MPLTNAIDPLGHAVVIGRSLDRPEQADWSVREVGIVESGKRERVRRVIDMRVVHDQGVFAYLGDVDGLDRAVAPKAQTMLAARTVLDRLAVLQPHDIVLARTGFGDRSERVVVEDRAVLVDLDERRAPVIGSRAQHAGEVLAVRVDRASYEAGLGAERERQRVE